MKKTFSLVLVLVLVLAAQVANATITNQAPIADAGLSRYAATDPVQLDGIGSYDPDSSGSLSYSWRQIAGPSVAIMDTETATPMISGFVQTSEIQECEFELVVSDGKLTSPPDTVKVIIVPTFGANTLRQENPPFDPDKPTVIHFGGGNCVDGSSSWNNTAWAGWDEKANIIIFPYYRPDSRVSGSRTYYIYGDMIIVYLSSVAPDYKQSIQTIGFSTGGDPAMDVGIHLNRVYRDARYAVNRVTELEGGCRSNQSWPFYFEFADLFLTSAVAGEQCWIDDYSAKHMHYPLRDVLAVSLGLSHTGVRNWYRESLTGNDMNNFNSGVVAGAYWSVIGPGKNLQLAPQTDAYYFRWDGNEQSGRMSVYDEALHSGRLPEPVTLVGPVDVGDPNVTILTCEESENAVGYQLLFGPDPYRVMDYNIISDTPTPPDEIITTLPFEKTWWTVRVRDEYGSTIYADPKPIGIVNLSFPVENISTRKRYSYIQDAIDDAVNGDEIMLSEGNYHENIDINGKNLTLRSTNPNDPATVAATVINGGHRGLVVTFFSGEEANSVLDGFTITGGSIGISCRDASPTIRNCTIESNGSNAIEFWQGYKPTIIDCTILGQVVEVYNPTLVAYWKLDEAEGMIAYDSNGDNDGTLHGNPAWQPSGGKVDGALAFDGTDDYVSTDFVLDPADGPFSVFAWIKGGVPGQAVLSQIGRANWLCTDSLEGNLMTELKDFGRYAATLLSQAVITDGNWHRIGFVWNGSSRTLYVDDVEVAKDNQAGLQDSVGGLYIGTGKAMETGTFFSGLIDDVRIYNRAVRP